MYTISSNELAKMGCVPPIGLSVAATETQEVCTTVGMRQDKTLGGIVEVPSATVDHCPMNDLD